MRLAGTRCCVDGGADALLEVEARGWFAELWRRRARRRARRSSRSCPAPGPCCSTASPTRRPRPSSCAAGRRRPPAGVAARPRSSRSRSCTTDRTWPTSPSSGASPTPRRSTGSTGTELRVAFCGFAPGFAYLAGLPEELAGAPAGHAPRRGCRPGRSALAGRYAGIYPTASPGGWRLVGRTDVTLFDLDRDPPALLTPGHPGPVASGRAMIEVVTRRAAHHGAGPRPARLRPPRRGPVRRARRAGAARWPTALVGNPDDAAGLETTLTGCALRAGRRPHGRGHRRAAPRSRWTARGRRSAPPSPVPAGCVARGRPGARPASGPTWPSPAGSTVAPVLGSRSTDTLSGLGPPPLRRRRSCCRSARADRRSCAP